MLTVLKLFGANARLHLIFTKSPAQHQGTRKREKAVNTAWDAWEALGKQPVGHDVYKKVRQFYKDMHTALRAAQDQRS